MSDLHRRKRSRSRRDQAYYAWRGRVPGSCRLWLLCDPTQHTKRQLRAKCRDGGVDRGDVLLDPVGLLPAGHEEQRRDAHERSAHLVHRRRGRQPAESRRRPVATREPGHARSNAASRRAGRYATPPPTWPVAPVTPMSPVPIVSPACVRRRPRRRRAQPSRRAAGQERPMPPGHRSGRPARRRPRRCPTIPSAPLVRARRPALRRPRRARRVSWRPPHRRTPRPL